MLLLLAGIVLLVLVQIFQRYLPVSAPWTEEMSRYLFVYLTFLGSALLIKEKGHIVVDLLVDRLPRRIGLAVFVAVQLLVLLFLYVFTGGALEMTLASTRTTASSMTWFNMAYLYGMVWIGGLLMALYALIEVVKGGMRLVGREPAGEAGEER